jgi:hypothetical protein
MQKPKNKNLIYYTVFDKGDDYVELLYISIKSLIKTSTILNYDILILTDESTKIKIEKHISSRLNFALKYEIFPSPIDGIEASKMKLHVFKYQKIDIYDTILFLDADTLIIKDISVILNNKWKKNILYTAYNKNLTFQHHTMNLFHGLDMINETQMNRIMKYNQKPFNAGQFLFKNTKQMYHHFNNVIWLMENWPDYHFFEQSFMNHYFCTNNLTNCELFNRYVNVMRCDTLIEPDKDTSIIHFIGPALNGKEKIDHINYYQKFYNL